MRFPSAKLGVLWVFGLLASNAMANDWLSAPGKYSHDAAGIRVNQHTPIGPVYTYPRGDFLRSGYRHIRSSIQVGGSSDNYHVVEEWGRAVRPYGEWQRPFRPYSVPYQLWGAPYSGMYQPLPNPFPYLPRIRPGVIPPGARPIGP